MYIWTCPNNSLQSSAWNIHIISSQFYLPVFGQSIQRRSRIKICRFQLQSYNERRHSCINLWPSRITLFQQRSLQLKAKVFICNFVRRAKINLYSSLTKQCIFHISLCYPLMFAIESSLKKYGTDYISSYASKNIFLTW